MKTMLLKLSGPMQSWGTKSHFETRHSDYYPSKSAIWGMILAAMGIRREETEEWISILQTLDFMVRVDQPGRLLKDYQIARSYKPNGDVQQVYVTERYYIEDGVFLVALGNEDESLLKEIEEALRYPYFQPFMGRRSLPLPVDFFLGIQEGNVKDCLQKEPWHAGPWFQKKNRKNREYHTFLYGDERILPGVRGTKRKDEALSFSQKNREFQYRYEAEAQVAVRNPFYEEIHRGEHDAFGAIGGKYVYSKSEN